MAQYFRIRRIVKTDRPNPHERIDAICGLNADGSHWTLTQEDAVSRIEDGTCAFYLEGPRGQRHDVIVGMDVHAHRYLKTADRDQPDQVLFLPACPHVAHTRYSVLGQRFEDIGTLSVVTEPPAKAARAPAGGKSST
jgi:hypothetical protein